MSNFTKSEAGREVTLGMQALKRIGKPEGRGSCNRVLGYRQGALDHRCQYPCGRWIKALVTEVIQDGHRADQYPEVLVLYRKRSEVWGVRKLGVIARFRYNDLK